MTPNAISYAVITPVKNEERFIGTTAACMISQSIKPVVWMIVDDASTDGTAQIVKDYAGKYCWVLYRLYPGEVIRRTGSAEIHAFDYGLRALHDLAFDLIVKLDGDLRFDECYFENLLLRFMNERKLGIASGMYLEETAAHSWKPVAMPDYHAAGASKVVRRECYEQIGGFLAVRGWDTIDEIRAHARGWHTAHFPDIRFFHLRKEGTGMGQVHTNVMHGEIYYRTGGSLVFFLLKAFYRMLRGRPILLAGAAMMYGYIAAFLRRQEPLVDPAEARAYRRLLYRRLRGGLKRLWPERS